MTRQQPDHHFADHRPAVTPEDVTGWLRRWLPERIELDPATETFLQQVYGFDCTGLNPVRPHPRHARAPRWRRWLAAAGSAVRRAVTRRTDRALTVPRHMDPAVDARGLGELRQAVTAEMRRMARDTNTPEHLLLRGPSSAQAFAAARRRPPRRTADHRPGTADILEQISAAVEQRCAGPDCHQTLAEDRISAYFCSPECQQAWHHARADNPDEVLQAHDAAPVHIGHDDRRVPLDSAPATDGSAYRAVGPCTPPRWANRSWREEHLGYRSRCRQCGALGTLTTIVDRLEATNPGPPRVTRISHHHTLACRACDGLSPSEPVLRGRVHYDDLTRLLTFTLTDGQRHARAVRLSIELRGDARESADRIWAQLHADIAAQRAIAGVRRRAHTRWPGP